MPRLQDFDFELPDEAIARRPAESRSRSRLLHLDGPKLRDLFFEDLPATLQPGDLLVVNDTKVLPARLLARRPTGGRVEVLLVERLAERHWSCLLRPGRRLDVSSRLELEDGLDAKVVRRENGRFELEFSKALSPSLERLGQLPLPPYLGRPADSSDTERYQTVFAEQEGAIAAPTAGLHFDQPLLDELDRSGIRRVALTLHVGPCTFQPVRVDDVSSHRLESERYRVSKSTASAIAKTRTRGGRVIAVGTTVVRTLEWIAQRHDGQVVAESGRSELFVYPPFEFQVVDALITNFHLPRSTLLMLVSALAGSDRIRSAYQHAIAEGYRFYSYGDAMLIDPGAGAC